MKRDKLIQQLAMQLHYLELQQLDFLQGAVEDMLLSNSLASQPYSLESGTAKVETDTTQSINPALPPAELTSFLTAAGLIMEDTQGPTSHLPPYKMQKHLQYIPEAAPVPGQRPLAVGRAEARKIAEDISQALSGDENKPDEET